MAIVLEGLKGQRGVRWTPLSRQKTGFFKVYYFLLFGEKSNLPFYYRKLAGNIPDVKTVKHLLSELAFLSSLQIKLVMDRGFYSEANINSLVCSKAT